MIKIRVLRVIKMHFSLKVIPQYLKKSCLWQLAIITSWKTAEYDQVCRLLYKVRGLTPPRPLEAVEKMLQIL